MDVTIKDIAKECGVSVSSVSRALNNHPDINPKTKARIMKVIRERGFVPNNSARNMRRSETNNIALLVKGITKGNHKPVFHGNDPLYGFGAREKRLHDDSAACCHG